MKTSAFLAKRSSDNVLYITTVARYDTWLSPSPPYRTSTLLVSPISCTGYLNGHNASTCACYRKQVLSDTWAPDVGDCCMASVREANVDLWLLDSILCSSENSVVKGGAIMTFVIN